MYKCGREHHTEKNHYSICFSWIMLATFGPFIIQFSTYMSMLYHKEWYTDGKFKNAGKCKQIFLIITLTCFGAIVMFIIDMLQKIEAMVNFIMIPFSCKLKSKKPIRQSVQEGMKWFFKEQFDLNQFDLEQFNQQRKYTQMIYEDIVMFALNIFIFSGILIVPKVFDNRSRKIKKPNDLLLQFGSTVLAIYMAVSALVFESRAMQENFMEYLFISLKAKICWVPYVNALEKNKLYQDINFDDIRLRQGGALKKTDMLGMFKEIEFKFSDLTLRQLARQIQCSW